MGDARIDLAALSGARDKLRALGNLDPRPMLEDFGKVIVEDNRAGILAGVDALNRPMKPVTYRGSRARKDMVFRSAKSGKFGTTTGSFKGRSLVTILPNNNLTTAQYRKLDGPPTAPRRDESRVIANLVLRDPYKVDGTTWAVEAYWNDVLDPKGRPFLPYLFRTRPLDGIRAEGYGKMRQLAVAWVRYWWQTR